MRDARPKRHAANEWRVPAPRDGRRRPGTCTKRTLANGRPAKSGARPQPPLGHCPAAAAAGAAGVARTRGSALLRSASKIHTGRGSAINPAYGSVSLRRGRRRAWAERSEANSMSAAPGVRLHSRFRTRGTEYVSESGMERVSGGARR
jgi:hypothetical protein